MTEPYYMINTEAHMKRDQIIMNIGRAAVVENESRTAYEIGKAVVEALEQANFEIVWLGHK